MTDPTTGPGGPTDADRALVAREIERLTAAAGPGPAGYAEQTPEHLYYMGWVEILTSISTEEAVAQVRADALKALTGRRTGGVMEAAPGRRGWLAELDDSIRRRNAIRQLNRERVRLRLPKLTEPGDILDEATAAILLARERGGW